MSTTIDQKVVEMRFDNRHFEQHTRETMSTLDKLKQKLNLSGAAKGLDNINTSANKVNMSGLASSVQTVQARFSALEVVGVTALANITNSALNAGKRIISALTIDPVKTGFQEYETQLNAVQTILANTKHKGKTLEDVNAALDELNHYADQTIYNFTEMTKNIGLFTNAGVGLEESVAAIKGFSNAAAMAGADATKTAGAMYQLSQAMSSGVVKLMDWRSLTTANIAGERFIDAIKITASTYGINVDEMIEAEGTFQDTLKDGWLTADMMAEALNHYTLSRKTMTKAEQDAATEMYLANGYTEEQIDLLFELGTEATGAATEVKSLTQMFDVLKEAAQSGWAKSWQIVFGDLYEAKALFTPMANFLTNIIDGISDFRNELLEGALGRSFGWLVDGISETTQNIKESIDTIKDYTQVVDDIIGGQWGNGQERWDALSAAGYDWAHAQNLVNEKLGNSLRRATTYKEVQEEVAEAQEHTTKATKELIIELVNMSDKQLEAAGYTDEQIASLRELQRVAKQTGIPLKTFIDNIDEIDGRWILINTFKNAMQGLSTVVTSLKEAWVDTIGVITSDHLFDLIAALHKFSTHLTVSDETADKLKRTFSGMFAVLDMALTLTTGPLALVGRLLLNFLQALDFLPDDILGVTAVIGDYLVALRDWMDNMLDLTDVFAILLPYLQLLEEKVNKYFKIIGESEPYQNFIKGLKKTKEAVVAWMKGMLETEDLSKYLYEGLMKGLTSGYKVVVDFIINFAKTILLAIRKVLGIESPSKEFYEIGKNIMQGLFNGVSDFVKMVYTLVMSIGDKLVEIVSSLDLGSIFTIAVGSTAVYGFVKIANAISDLTSPLGEADYVVKQFGKTLNGFSKALKGIGFRAIAEGIKSIAIGIAILAGSVAVLSLLDQGKLWSAVGAISLLMVLLGGLTYIAGTFGGKEGLSFGKVTLSLLGVAAAILLMAGALKKISSIDPKQGKQTLIGFAAIVGALLLITHVVSKNGDKLATTGLTFLAIGAAFLLLAKAAKTLSKIDWTGLGKAGAAITGLVLIIAGLMWATQLISGSKNVSKIGGAILSVAGALLMLLIVAKIAGRMDPDELKQGMLAIGLFGIFIISLMSATQLITGSKNVDKIGGAILGIATAMIMMAFACKIMGSMGPEAFAKGIIAIAIFSTIVSMLIETVKLAGGKNVGKIGGTILSISVAIGLLAITAALLSMIELGALAKGVAAVGFLTLMIRSLIKATKGAKNITGTMIAITVSIGLLSLALGLLSLIKFEKLGGAALALGFVLGMFALIVKASGSIKKSWGTLVTLTVALVVLSAALYFIAELPIENALAASVSLSLLLGTLSLAMLALSKMNKVSTNALLGVLGLAALCIPLYILVDILSKLSNVNNVMENALALSVFIGMLSLVLMACAVVGEMYVATFGLAATGLLGLVAILGMLYMVIDVLKKMSEIESATENMMALTSFMKEMTKILIALALVGPLLLTATVALTGLTGLMVTLGALAVGIGYLMDKMPKLEKFLDTGIPVMIKLAGGIGEMLGVFMKGALSNITSALPQMGKDLSDFMDSAEGFISGANNIKSEAMNGIKALAEAILIITGTDILQRLLSFGKDKNVIANFGTSIGDLATGIKDFSDEIGVFDDDKIKTIECACQCIKILAEAAKAMPGEDGFWQKLAGDKSLVAFGDNLPTLGEKIAEFANKLGTFDDTKCANVENAGEAIKYLATAAKSIPNDGGLWGILCGENSLATFSDKLPDLGTNLNNFVTNLGSFDDAKVLAVENAGKAINHLTTAAKSIPNDGGLWGALCGDNSLATFSDELPDLGKNLSEFVGKLSTLSDKQIASVDSVVKVIDAILNIGGIDVEATGKGLKSIGKNMIDFAKNIKSFTDEVAKSGKDSIESAINKTEDLINMAVSIANVNVGALSTFGDSLKSAAKDGVKGFVDAISSKVSKANATQAAKNLVQAVIDGVKNKTKKSSLEKEAKAVAQAAVKAFGSSELKIGATEAGKDLVQGLINGLTSQDKRNEVYNAAYSLGELAVQGELDGQESQSPSKATKRAGKWLGEGLVIGIKNMSSKVYGAGQEMGKEATNSISGALNTAMKLLNSDMDSQPTIRPVLDLSEVESGASYLNSMFNNGPSLGVSANLSAISSGVQQKLQNGVNSDVISAIDKLRGDLNNTPRGDTFNVNGITYDDGTNISNAVRDLIRAAKVERRV